MPALPASPGYAQLPRNYASQPPPPPGYNVGWQYTDPNVPQSARASLAGTASGIMAPTQRNVSIGMMRSTEKRADEYFAYQYQAGVETIPRTEEPQTVPVLLCHTCSICGQMRSAGYHRSHPVIPGKPIVTTSCRKCTKFTKSQRTSKSRSYTRVRTCTADEPCGWPRKPIQMDVDNSERRGRRRSRDEIYASWKTDHLRPRIVKEGSSQANIGLRTLQRSPTRGYRSETRVRVSSLSPGRSRYDGVWPPPDVVRMRPSRPDELYPATDEVWPPPDVVRTHFHRKKSAPHLSPRIVELSPSPPPPRSRATRVSYRRDSQERQPTSSVQRSESRVRLASHPGPYRTVIPDHRVFSQSDETSTNDAGSESIGRGILKPADMNFETSYRKRTSIRDSQQSTNVEVGGPRVQFASERSEEPRPNDRSDDGRYEQRRRYESFRYAERPASPPTDHTERLHLRRSSSSPQRSYDEIRIDRARRISPSPPRLYEEVRVRHISASPSPSRERKFQPPPSHLSSGKSVRSGYRHVPRTHAVGRTRSSTPPATRNQMVSEDDVTDSENEEHDQFMVRSWKGIDENGQPAIFVEGGSKVRMIDQGSVGGSDFRPLTDRLAARSWREV
ncbi:uncharacterized protein EKO05_0002173 [Ascochyta rabiei]|nr:uncharacterized protein EKO05_0002173 [Ascochyta rabiei]UPX11574.1 hypothetical protein EKO05_0002173 [Ascochyta rabiei]